MTHEIRVFKSAGLLEHRVDGVLRGAYPAEVGRNRHDKEQEGDEATPLGEFFICARNPRSRFHRSLCLAYPNRVHAERGLQQKLIDRQQFDAIVQALEARRMPPQKTRLGGEIYLHGRSRYGAQGTRGCVAVDDAVIEMLFDALPLGTRVNILP
jgi:murein L,D-transpeptidase YafK